MTWCLLQDLQVAGTDHGGCIRGQGEAWLACEWAAPATPVTSGVGKKEKKRALQPSTTHCCSHFPGKTPTLKLPLPNALGGAQVPRHLVTIPLKDLTTRRSWGSTFYTGQMGQGVYCVVCRQRGHTATVIPDSRGGHGPPPLGIPEQKSLAAPATSEGTTEKDIVTEHHLLLLLLPWEHTRPAAATAKNSGQCPDA